MEFKYIHTISFLFNYHFSEKNLLKTLGDQLVSIQEATEKLAKASELVKATEENADSAAAQHIIPVMNEIRRLVDGLETTVPDKSWPYPKYTELLFSI